MTTTSDYLKTLLDLQTQSYQQVLALAETLRQDLSEDTQLLRESLNSQLETFRLVLEVIVEDYAEKRQNLLEEAQAKIDAINQGKYPNSDVKYKTH